MVAVFAFLTQLLVLLACSLWSVSAHAEPHPLSRVNLANIRTQLDGGVSTRPHHSLQLSTLRYVVELTCLPPVTFVCV